MPRRNFHEIFEQFRHHKVVVIGDVMVDAYIFGKVERISPEAPVPVVTVERRVNRLGGAANVALNLKSLGAEPCLCSVIGNDTKGEEFRQLMSQAGIDDQAVVGSNDRKTTTKFRVIGNKSQMLRVDEEMTDDLSRNEQQELFEKIKGIMETTTVAAVIFQDYNKGVLTAELISQVTGLAKKMGVPVAVDPKKNNFFQYKQASLFKPNLKELRDGLHRDINADNPESLREAAASLHLDLGIEIIMTTMSEHGVFVSYRTSDGKILQEIMPAHLRNVADVSGAGDTVISVATLCLASGLDPLEIAALSNLAGGIVCEEVGVVPIDREKLLMEALRI